MVAADVAIIGYGPVGQALAGYLGQAGVSVAVFERDRYVFERARTGGVDDETMRFLQGGLAERVMEGTRIPGDFRFLSADGRVLLSWAAGEQGRNGYARMYLWHQPDVDHIVRQYVDTLESVDVRLEHIVDEVIIDEDRVRVRATDRVSGREVDCEARYVVGCDGGRSVVRPVLDGAFEALAESERWVVVDLTLTREVARLPDEGCHYCDPRRPTTFIRNVGERRRWEFMVLPGEDPVEMERPEQVWALLRPWLAPDDAEIYRAVGYTFHSLLATRWRNRRALIAGDAAHLMPPFLGQGLCSGFRDVRNLAWKLIAVLAGRADEGLLDTYGSERAPHVKEFIEMSVRLGSVIQTLDPVVAAKRDADMLTDPNKTVHTPIPKLGAGLLPESAESPLGTLFPQPRLTDGRLLDTASGERFTLLGLPSLISSIDRRRLDEWARHEVAVIADESPETVDALEKVDAEGVLIRPDRYLLARVGSVDDLDRAAASIPWALEESRGMTPPVPTR